MVKKSNKNRGFSLVELAVVLVIAGLITSSALQAYNLFIKRKGLEDTQGRMAAISSALLLFYSENGRYPCPANITLDQNDAASGRESCPAATPTIGSCENGICRAAGARDVGADLIPDPVLIGGIPFKDLNISLNLSMQDTVDGWGRQMTYAVTEALTSQLTFDAVKGAIAVTNEAGTSLLSPPGSAHITVISHGPDGKGGYTSSGKMSKDCTGTGVDLENCDNDSLFINGVTSLVDGANYFDDYIIFQLWKVTTLWAQSPVNSNDIYNLNPGNIGIGTVSPTEKLHVTGNVKANDVLSMRFCDVTGNDCFPAQTIGGSGISCPTSQAMTGISYNAPECAAVTLPTSIVPGTCPTGQFVKGIDASGNIVCGAP